MTTLAKLFAVDLRSLALLRIGLATLLLVDLADRAVFLQAHYTDSGIFPRIDAVREHAAAQWSLHLMAGTSSGQAILFGIAAVFAVLLLLGWRTRVVVVVCWLLLVSLQARTPPVAYGADGVLRALLFFGMFLPLEGRWSLDELFGRVLRKPDTHHSIAAAALTIQIALIYVLTGLQKLGDPSWLRLDAVYFALASDHHATSIGLSLSRHMLLMQGLALLTLLLEIAAPFLLLVPLARARVRMGLIAAFVFFHVCLGLTLHLGLFSWVSVLAWLALMPREAWERAGIPTRAGVDVVRARASCRSSAAAARAERSAAVFLVAALAVGIVAGLDNVMPSWSRPAPLRAAAQLLGLEQRWSMFIRPMHDGWLIVSAQREPLANTDASASGADESAGRDARPAIDLLRKGAPVTFERPARIADQHKSMRWRKYFGDLTFQRASSKRNRLAFLRYLCRGWNDNALEGERVTRVDLVFMQADDLPDGTQAPVLRRVLASRACGPPGSLVNDSAAYFEMKPDDDDTNDDTNADDTDGTDDPDDTEAPGAVDAGAP